MGAEVPKCTPEKQEEYRKFCNVWMRENLTPLTPDEFITPEDWLEGLDFSELRKEQLREAMHELNQEGINFDDKRWQKKFAELNSFIKDEFYPAYKASRWINARNDKVKCWFGPLVQMVMNKFKAMSCIIKTVPVEERGQYLYDMFYDPANSYACTDFTTFEAHFEKWLMIIEGDLYDYILQNHPLVKLLKVFVNKILGGDNEAWMRGFGKFIFVALRCSGEMNTSLGNTFHNLCIVQFLAYKNGAEEVIMVAEGDDSLTVVRPATAVPTTPQFEEYGWVIKIEIFNELGDASFCGNVFAKEDMIVVTDPRKILLSLGWCGRRYQGASEKFLSGLFKSKVLSMGCQYGRNPVIWALAKRLLSLLVDVKIRKTVVESDAYKREILTRALEEKFEISEPGMATRHLVARLYNVSLQEQFLLEKEFSVIELGPWEAPIWLFTDEDREKWINCTSIRPWYFKEDGNADEWRQWLKDNIQEDEGSPFTLIDDVIDGYCIS
jgi:hypothetical protein